MKQLLFSLMILVIVVLCCTVSAKTSSLAQDYLHKLITEAEAELEQLNTKSDTNSVHNRAPGDKEDYEEGEAGPSSPKKKRPFIRRLSDLSLRLKEGALELPGAATRLSQKAASSVSNKFRWAGRKVIQQNRQRNRQRGRIREQPVPVQPELQDRFRTAVQRVMLTQREQKGRLSLQNCKSCQFSQQKARDLFQQVDHQIIELLLKVKPQDNFEIPEESFTAGATDKQKCRVMSMKSGHQEYFIEFEVRQQAQVHPCSVRVSKSKKRFRVGAKFQVARVFCKSLYPSPILNLQVQ